jgi:hypothetical protein
MMTQQVFILISSYRVQFHARRALACSFGLLFSVGSMHGAKTRALSLMVQEPGREVDDAATAELMKRFYRGVLQEKLTPAAALRAAHIEMLRKSHWQSPYYWGASVLQGEWR